MGISSTGVKYLKWKSYGIQMAYGMSECLPVPDVISGRHMGVLPHQVMLEHHDATLTVGVIINITTRHTVACPECIEQYCCVM